MDTAADDVVREAAQRGPDGGGGGAEKNTSVGGGGGRAYAIHCCGGDGRTDGESVAWTRWRRRPGGRGGGDVDLTVMEMAGRTGRHRRGPDGGGGGRGGGGVDSTTWKKARENLAT
jgi:hypothetical protein